LLNQLRIETVDATLGILTTYFPESEITGEIIAKIEMLVDFIRTSDRKWKRSSPPDPSPTNSSPTNPPDQN
jgi:hypothetical protein